MTTNVDTHAPVAYSTGEAIRVVFRTVFAHWKTCLAIASVYAVLLGLANAVARSSTAIVDPTTLLPSEVASAGVEALIAIGVFWVVNIFVGPITLGALSLVGSAAVYDDKIATAGIVRRAVDRGLDAVATAVMIGLFLVLPVVIVGFVSLVLMVATSVFGFAVLVFGTIFVGLPVLYVFVRLSLAIPVVMREGRGPIDALRRSWGLVRGAWWRVFGVAVVMSLVIGTVIFFLSLQSFFGRDTTADFVMGIVTTTLASAIVVTFYGVASGVVYAMRAPEDTLPPEVAEQEARLEADATQNASLPE